MLKDKKQASAGIDSQLPCNKDVEKLLLGQCVCGAFGDIYPRVQPDHFYFDACRTIFSTMVALHENGDEINEFTVNDRLWRDDLGPCVAMLNEAGSDVQHLVIDGKRVSVASAIKMLERDYLARQMIAQGADAIAAAYQGNTEEAQGILEELAYTMRMQDNRSQLVATADLANDFLTELEVIAGNSDHLLGVTSGLNDLDRLLNGFNRSDLIILAARPAIGKTALALNFARSAAKAGHVTALFSLEMGQQQLMRRLLSGFAGVDQEKLKTGWLDDEDWDLIIAGMKELASIPLYIDDTAGISVEEIKSKCKNLMASGTTIDMILVDYIQLMGNGKNSNGAKRSREQEVSEISRNLKHLARELNIPVIALAQLSRAVESRQSKVPQLSDLRESGALEQDADIVMFIYRDEVYNPETERKNIADIIVAKHRNGPVGEVSVYFDKAKSTFRNLEVLAAGEEEE